MYTKGMVRFKRKISCGECNFMVNYTLLRNFYMANICKNMLGCEAIALEEECDGKKRPGFSVMLDASKFAGIPTPDTPSFCSNRVMPPLFLQK